MGMSASQARLIALTARMSDTEYEAQQINQQRLTLSNQMNAVYEAMCNMDVPTPPSKLDPRYMKTVYKGKQGGSDVTAKVNDDGTVSAYNTVNGDVVKNAGCKKVGIAEDPEKHVIKDQTYSASDFKTWDLSKATAYYSGSYTVEMKEYQGIVDGEKQYKTLPDAEIAFSGKTQAEVDGFKADVSYEENGITYTIKSDASKSVQYYTSEEFNGQLSENEIRRHNEEANELAKKSFVKQNADGTYDIVNISSIGEGDTVYECDADFQKARLSQKEGRTKGTTVGGNAVMSLSAAEQSYGSLPAFSNAVNGLQHTFADNKAWQNFSVIVDTDDKGGYTFSFCMTDDIENGDDVVQTWQYAQGEYDEKIGDLSKDQVTYDGNGNISSAIINGQNTPLTMEREIDEYAYEAAMNKYNSDKAVYDQEQNKLNKQTSIYQRQDKMLEMKLTRLDNERNALNTEIEAVKKVIQDAIDRGFKTFSG